MGCCVGKSAEVTPGGEEHIIAPGKTRKCRDLFWLLLYMIFMVGMFTIGAFAFIYGDLNRIVYGVDSMGNICGSANNKWNGTAGPNLVNRTQLYYLDPTQLWDAFNLPWAKKICVEECPQAESLCGMTEPCAGDSQYRCPYYFAAERELYGYLPTIEDPLATQYFGALASTTKSDCNADHARLGVGGAAASMASDIHSLVSSSDPEAAAGACGLYYQGTSRVVAPALGMLGPCYPVVSKTVSYLNRCFPDLSAVADALDAVKIGNRTVVKAISDGIGSKIQLYITDAYRGAVIAIGCGVFGGCLLSAIWMVILRYFAGCMAWTCVILVNLLFMAGTVLCFQKAGMLGQAGAAGQAVTAAINEMGLPSELNPSLDAQRTWEIVAWVALAVSLLVIIFTLLMMKRVKIAVACLKVASQAVASIPSVMIFPLLPMALEIIFILYWLAVCALLYSTGQIVMKYRGPLPNASTTVVPQTPTADANVTGGQYDFANSVGKAIEEILISVGNDVNLSDEDCYRDPNCAFQLQWDSTLQYLALYHLFGLLWTLQFIAGYGQVALSGAFAIFYWHSGDESRMPAQPLCSAMCNALKACGSIALGSLIVAIIQFVRIFLEYIDRKTKSLQEDSPLIKYIICCLKCCMWCLEKVMKFLNRNAYIMVAVKGDSYCRAAGRAFTLLVSNVLRVAAVNVVGDSLMFMGKLTIVAGCGVSAFFLSGIEYFTSPVKYPDMYLSSPLVPVLGSVFCAWFIASTFFEVYATAIDTILLCFCEDCETNNGDPKHAPEKLMKAMGMAHGKS